MIPGRRQLLGAAGALLGAGVTGTLAGRLSPAFAAPSRQQPLPWPYTRLDPDVVAERAY